MQCDRCQVNLTFHQAQGRAVCHQCGRKFEMPAQCPVCSHKLIRFGLGTQRIEEELVRKFPHIRYARLDSDTMKRAGDYERILGDFEHGDLDVLLGTQMIAKGLDFPNVTLVGVISADTTLAIPDFRASERTFQLICQVAGRAGRKHGQGRVVIQTLHGDLPAVHYATQHDYVGFADSELPLRRDLGFPPFGRLALFVLRHGNPTKVRGAASALADRLKTLLDELVIPEGRVRSPTVAPIARIRNQYRYHLLIQTRDGDGLRHWLSEARRRGLLELPVDWIVDVDPLALM
jgi:primosomal protein N' (replication factor Y)